MPPHHLCRSSHLGLGQNISKSNSRVFGSRTRVKKYPGRAALVKHPLAGTALSKEPHMCTISGVFMHASCRSSKLTVRKPGLACASHPTTLTSSGSYLEANSDAASSSFWPALALTTKCRVCGLPASRPCSGTASTAWHAGHSKTCAGSGARSESLCVRGLASSSLAPSSFRVLPNQLGVIDVPIQSPMLNWADPQIRGDPSGWPLGLHPCGIPPSPSAVRRDSAAVTTESVRLNCCVVSSLRV